ncbi:MAG: peptidylprolyl isomerase, partial [Clostridia bacterium]|nr:peptidylprolyl isomerase [Clostridia bacterium]
AKHILITTVDPQTNQPYDDTKKAEAKKTAEDALEKIKSGADFDSLMNELSEDPGLAQNPDGYTFGKGEMVAPFEEAAFALKEGEVSGIVESDFGYHIIKRVPLNISQSDIENKIKEMQNDIFENQIEKWKSDMDVSIDEKALAKIKAN